MQHVYAHMSKYKAALVNAEMVDFYCFQFELLLKQITTKSAKMETVFLTAHKFFFTSPFFVYWLGSSLTVPIHCSTIYVARTSEIKPYYYFTLLILAASFFYIDGKPIEFVIIG